MNSFFSPLFISLVIGGLTSCQSSAIAKPSLPAPLPNIIQAEAQGSGTTTPAQIEQHDTTTSDTLHRYSLRALHYSNLFYQLDCLSGQGYCSKESFETLWKSLGWTAEDDAQINAWQNLKQKYNQQIQLPLTAKKTSVPAHFEGLILWEQVRQAAMNSPDRQSLLENLALTLQPQDAEALAKIIFHFEQRFFSWWDPTGQPLAENGANAFAEQLQKSGLANLIEQASSFYQAELNPNSLLGFNFIARPDLGTNTTVNGEQVNNQSLIEIKENANIINQMDVVIHELSHYLYRRSSRQNEALLIQRFSELKSADAIAAYNLLNEAIATAIGNGIVNRMLMPFDSFQRMQAKEGSFYNDAWLDPLAKAIYPRVAEAIKKREPLNSQSFIHDYVQLAQKALGPKLQSPVPLLRVMGAAYEPELTESVQNFQQALRIGSYWGANGLGTKARSTFENYKDLSGVIMVRPAHLDYLTPWKDILGEKNVKEIQSTGKHQNLVYGVKRSKTSYIFVFVAPNSPTINQLVAQFAQQKTRFEGLMP